MKTWKKVTGGITAAAIIGGSIYGANKLNDSTVVSDALEVTTEIASSSDVAVAEDLEESATTEDSTTTETPVTTETLVKEDEESHATTENTKWENNAGTGISNNSNSGNGNGNSNTGSNAGNGNSNTGSNTGNGNNSQTTEATKPEKPATTEIPQHVHNYSKWVVDQAAYDETVVVKEAYTETVNHPEEGYNVLGCKCHYCGQVFASGAEADAHAMTYVETDRYHFAAGWGSANYWVKTKDAWTETINHPAETKTVHHDEVGHWECSCGARK